MPSGDELTRFRKLIKDELSAITDLVSIIGTRFVHLWPSDAAEFPCCAYSIESRTPLHDFPVHGWNCDVRVRLFGPNPDVLDQAERAIVEYFQSNDMQDQLTDTVVGCKNFHLRTVTSGFEPTFLVNGQVLEVRDLAYDAVIVDLT